MKRSTLLLICLAACSDSEEASRPAETEAVAGMHEALAGDLELLVQSVKDLETAAPRPAGRGWTAADDAAAIQSMKDAWVRARSAFERVEGSVAPLYPDVARSLDARYDDFLREATDEYLFDDRGITGLHAAERILFADTTPAQVVAIEQSLPGYRAAALPATEQEAADFKEKLLGRIVIDATLLRDRWQPARIDARAAFQGLVSLVEEQRKKVSRASARLEESPYSQRTMADLRENLAGSKRAYGLLKPWIIAKAGPAVDDGILYGFEKLDALYTQIDGDALPRAPVTWSAEAPSPDDLATPFGMLYAGVLGTVDPAEKGSVVDEMNSARAVLGLDPHSKQ